VANPVEAAREHMQQEPAHELRWGEGHRLVAQRRELRGEGCRVGKVGMLD
jgi:hypothetical protein